MMNSVQEYAYSLSGLTCSGVGDRTIVKKIRQTKSVEEAIVFFGKAAHPPSIARFIFYPIDQQRKTIHNLQGYLKDIGVAVPAPSESIQKFLDGGEYPAE